MCYHVLHVIYYKKVWLKMRSDNESFFEKKEEFRKFCIKKLKQTSQSKRFLNNKLINKQLSKVLNKYKFKNILLYLPLKMEVNVFPLIATLRKKHNVLVPFMQGVSFKVVKYRLPIFKKKFSIYEPLNSHRNFSSIDVMIVPVVGVDGQLKRIGFGKGMYDRFFESLKKRPLVIFVQQECCCTKFLIGCDHDIQADIYITPKNIIKRGMNDNRSRFIRRSCGN